MGGRALAASTHCVCETVPCPGVSFVVIRISIPVSLFPWLRMGVWGVSRWGTRRQALKPRLSSSCGCLCGVSGQRLWGARTFLAMWGALVTECRLRAKRKRWITNVHSRDVTRGEGRGVLAQVPPCRNLRPLVSSRVTCSNGSLDTSQGTGSSLVEIYLVVIWDL